MKLVATIFFTLLSILPVALSAQKLPNKQEVSLRAPANIKTDGSAIEWGDQLQAYNSATDIFYTIANDDDKLYLIVQAKDPNVITKIVHSGITFTVNTSLKKDDENSTTITYPAYGEGNKPIYLNLDNKPQPTKDAAKNAMQADSFMTARNKQLTEGIKFIEVSGIKSTTGNLISIYNEEGIQAESRFDNKNCYTLELAIPVKYIGLKNNSAAKFSYNIKLNGTIPKGATITHPRPDIVTYTDVDGQSYQVGSGPGAMIQGYTTDFWGEYTLAK